MNRVLVTGATGLIGKALCDELIRRGDAVTRLTRTRRGAGDLEWDPASGRLDAAPLEGYDAVIHLAGENISAGRWTRSRRQLIRSSRVDLTSLLVGALNRLERPPRVFVSTSAVGYYGDRGDEVLTEESGPGQGFLADLCRDWEEAARGAPEIRTVILRMGVVLTDVGGALPRMLWPFRLGIGGCLGSGRQYMSWISLDDAVAVLLQVVTDERMSGPVNVVAPCPVTHLEFTGAVSRALNRPAILPVPAFVLTLLLGPMADELILASARVSAARLNGVGFRFMHPDIRSVLTSATGRWGPGEGVMDRR